MRLFTFPEKSVDHRPYVAWWRWVINAHASRAWPGLALEFEREILGVNDVTWRPGGEYRSVTLTHHLLWGQHHVYFDGCHCGFSLGFLHFNWSSTDCEKCFKEA